MSDQWLAQISWTEDGLVPAIAQEAGSGRVLMMAWMNRQSLQQTVAGGKAVYWSRSRQRLWHKGEESGHEQRVKEIRLDCDGDVVLLMVEQVGARVEYLSQRGQLAIENFDDVLEDEDQPCLYRQSHAEAPLANVV